MKKHLRALLFLIIFITLYLCMTVSAYDPMKRDLDLIRSVVPNPYIQEDICWMLYRSANRKEIEKYKLNWKKVDGIVFVGDSRVVGMSRLGGYDYIGKNGEGYDWFVNDAVFTLYDFLYSYPDHDVVLCFGVNDLPNIDLYVDFYRFLMDAYPDTRFWVASVNPCNDEMAESLGYYMRNNMIEPFNEIMKEAFPNQYIDCYRYLTKNGYATVDGIHYDDGTYLVIQEYCKAWIEYQINQ